MGGAGRGRVCLVTHEPGQSCTGDVFILRAARPDPVALFLFLASAAGRAQLLRLQNGVGTANLSADELLAVELPLLPDATQREVAARYAPIAAAHDMAMAALARGDAAGFARERARAEHTTLNEQFRLWLADYARHHERLQRYDQVIGALRGKVRVGRKLTRPGR